MPGRSFRFAALFPWVFVGGIGSLVHGSDIPAAAPGDWPWWRGPNFNGVAAEGERPPTTWSDTEHVVWRTPVPGRGHGSPCVAGNRVFLATADERDEVQSVLAFDRATGEQLWQAECSRGGFPKTHRKNTHATGTVACDGERLFVAFHHDATVTVHCLDRDGGKLWERRAGRFDPKVYEYGYAPSPLVHGDTVIVAADWEQGGWIAAFDRATGEPAWKTDRPRKLSFSSPIVARIDGRDQLLLCGCDLVAAYDPADGVGLWSTPGTTMATAGTMVWDGDVVFASGGYPKAETLAVRADGSGEVLWRNRQQCYEQSLLAHGGHLYAVTDQGIAFCWNGTTGEERWRERLEGPVSSSPVLAGGNVYVANEAGTTFVFAADPGEYRAVARNRLGDEAFATPAFCGNSVYARVADSIRGRRQEFLYCLGE